METTWGQHEDNVETTWGQHGDHGDVQTTWGQHGDNMRTMWRQLSGYHTDTPITIKAEAIHKADSHSH